MQEKERGRAFRAGFAIKGLDTVNVDAAISDYFSGNCCILAVLRLKNRIHGNLTATRGASSCDAQLTPILELQMQHQTQKLSSPWLVAELTSSKPERSISKSSKSCLPTTDK
jgi:hypothetical protein